MATGGIRRDRQQAETGGRVDESALFLRQATGLVRAWSIFDAFVYAFFSINLVTLGLYIISQMYFLQGALIPTLILSAVIILAEVVVYADRKSTRLNSSHANISYAVFCLKKNTILHFFTPF